MGEGGWREGWEGMGVRTTDRPSGKPHGNPPLQTLPETYPHVKGT